MKKKTAFRIRNWSEYNASLKQRGILTIWVSSEAVENWTTDELTGEPGASPTYTDLAIETMATVDFGNLIWALPGFWCKTSFLRSCIKNDDGQRLNDARRV
jgi:hypothetical protein